MVRKVIIICLVLFLLWPSLSKASTVNTPSSLENTASLPQLNILNPIADAVLQKSTAIVISVSQVSPITAMEVYANDNHLLGTASPLSSSLTWGLNWNTTDFSDGEYFLQVKANFYDPNLGQSIRLYSPKIYVLVKNTTVTEKSSQIVTNQQETTTSQQNSPTQTSQTSQANQTSETNQTSQSSQSSQTEDDIAVNTESEDETASQNESEEVTSDSNSKVEAKPIVKPINLSSNSRIYTVIKTITFAKKSDQQLLKIEQKHDQYGKNYLFFSGIAKPRSEVNISVASDIIILTARADSKGNWEYIFDKPLEAGRHKVSVDIIDPLSKQSQSGGTHDFFIAKASAAGNPAGESLNLIDATWQVYLKYLIIASTAILIAVLILFIMFYQKRKKIKK